MNNKELNYTGRKLTKILRHQINEFKHDKNGYVLIDDIKKSDILFKNMSIDDVKKIVANDNKSRFDLLDKDGKYYLRANQGHSIGNLDDDTMLTPLLKPIEGCFHGTFSSNINSIKKEGISRMTRKHIHIAESEDAKSGKRNSCDIKIYINMELALDEGIKFFQSKNKCILTPGNDDGILLPKYFLKIEKI